MNKCTLEKKCLKHYINLDRKKMKNETNRLNKLSQYVKNIKKELKNMPKGIKDIYINEVIPRDKSILEFFNNNINEIFNYFK